MRLHALAGLMALCAALAVAGDQEGDFASALRKIVIDSAAKGAKPEVHLTLFGKPTRTQVVSADEKGISVLVQGNKMPMAWKDVTAADLAGLAFAVAQAGADYVDIIRYCAKNGLPELAEKAGLLALEKDAALGPQVQEALALIPGKAPPPVPVAVQQSPDAPQPKEPGVSRPLSASGLTSAPSASNGGPRVNHDGRPLPPLPDLKAPVMFDTPEADALCAALQVFPKNSAWNEDISKLPVHPDSDKIINAIGAHIPIHVDFSQNFMLVPPGQKKVEVKLGAYARESDLGPYPVPDSAPIQGWPEWWSKAPALDEYQRVGEGDRHISVVDPVNLLLYEFFTRARPTAAGPPRMPRCGI